MAPQRNWADVQPWSDPAATGDMVPLVAGLTVVTAIGAPDGDYESVKTVSNISDTAVALDVAAEGPKRDPRPGRTCQSSFNRGVW